VRHQKAKKVELKGRHVNSAPRLFHFTFRIALDAENEDGALRAQAPQLDEGFNVTSSHHVDVQQYRTVIYQPAQRCRFLPASGFADIEAKIVEGNVQGAPRRGLFAHDQDFASGPLDLPGIRLCEG